MPLFKYNFSNPAPAPCRGFIFFIVKRLLFLLILGSCYCGYGQELYVYTEPASNMPAKSISAKVTAMVGDSYGTLKQRYKPEIMFGINKNLMIHGAATFSDMHTDKFGPEGAFAYAKYRFLSKDKVHAHFRMALFAEGGYSKNNLMYDELNVQGDISGLHTGVIATQLVNKFAASTTVGYVQAFYDKEKLHHTDVVDKALQYSLSAGYLILPIEYTSYEQLNFNVYTEFIGQRSLSDKKTHFIDMAPAIQFIFNSNSKLNLGYRFQLAGNAERAMTESFLISFEHTFFNALKKKK